MDMRCAKCGNPVTLVEQIDQRGMREKSLHCGCGIDYELKDGKLERMATSVLPLEPGNHYPFTDSEPCKACHRVFRRAGMIQHLNRHSTCKAALVHQALRK